MRGDRPLRRPRHSNPGRKGAQEKKGFGVWGGVRAIAVLTPGPPHALELCAPFPPFQVSLVDNDLLKFVKLEELVLSANQIKEIDTTNLPPTLKVKEPRFHSRSWSQCCPEALPLLCPPPPHRMFGRRDCAKGQPQALER